MKITRRFRDILTFQGINKSFYLFMVAIAMQFFSYCYLGELITSKNHEINEALYCSKWYEIKNLSDRKKIATLMMMTQKEKFYSVGDFKKLNLQTLREVEINNF
jgi:7tm Odorant receptor